MIGQSPAPLVRFDGGGEDFTAYTGVAAGVRISTGFGDGTGAERNCGGHNDQ